MAESISFIVPALNEQDNIEGTVADIFQAAGSIPGLFCEVLLFDDGSTDATGTLADRLAARDARIRVIHNQGTRGLGFNYFHGVELARNEYAMMVPGDREIPEPAIRTVLEQAGKADMIVPYMTGSEARPLGRRILSRAFVALLNLLFGLRMTYYNGPCLIRTALVRKVKTRTHGFAYMAAILITLLKSGRTFKEVAIPLQYRSHGSSKALAWKNILSVLGTISRLWLDVHLG